METLTQEEATAMLRRLEIASPKLYRDLIAAGGLLWNWPPDDERWNLTPHELRKLPARRRTAK